MCDRPAFVREIQPACGIGLPRVHTRTCQGTVAAAAAAHGGSACLAVPMFDRGPPIGPYACASHNVPERLRQLCALAGYDASPMGPEASPGVPSTPHGARATGPDVGAGLGLTGLGLLGFTGLAVAGHTGRLPTRYGRAVTKKVGSDVGKRRAMENSTSKQIIREAINPSTDKPRTSW